MSLLTARTTSSSNVIPRRCRVYGVWVLGGATNGTVTLTDPTTPTGTGGTTRLVIDVPGITTSGTTYAGYFPVGGGDASSGLSFNTGCAVALATAAGATVVFSPEGT